MEKQKRGQTHCSLDQSSFNSSGSLESDTLLFDDLEILSSPGFSVGSVTWTEIVVESLEFEDMTTFIVKALHMHLPKIFRGLKPSAGDENSASEESLESVANNLTWSRQHFSPKHIGSAFTATGDYTTSYLFGTEKAVLGLSHIELSRDDEVVILQGSRWPHLLRRHDDIGHSLGEPTASQTPEEIPASGTG